VGIVTDGDLLRALEDGINLSRSASDLMSTDPLWVSSKASVKEVIDLMNQRKVSILCVKEGGCLVGSVQLHDC
jgi:arabinose-5-phosphate isomerase